jgi:butyrate kinase
MSKEVVLTINPGSTSTKIGLFDRNGELKSETIDHSDSPISEMHSIIDQLPLRVEIINSTCIPWLGEHNLVAVVGRGGLLGPLESGVYAVNNDIKDVTINCRYASHASNLGASIADGIAQNYKVPAFIVDPVTVDEFIPEARISGVPEYERRSRLHALNINACVRKAAQEIGKDVKESNFVVAHLGGGISVAAINHGRIIDCNDALMGMGPFSPERAGALPLEGLIKLALSGKYTFKDFTKKLTKNSGVKGYLGTSNMKDIEDRIDKGDKKADLIFKSMIYQIAKEIGAMATTLNGKVDRIIITGGQARSKRMIKLIEERVGFISDKIVYPGENELESMAEGGFLAIDKKVEIKLYKNTL